MRILNPFVMVVVVTITMAMTVLTTSQTLPAPQAITDPKLITSKPDARVEKSLSIERLYMTRQVAGSTWSPDGKWIAYMSDYDGDEQWDIFLVSPKTGQVVNLTNTREISEENPTWSPDGRYLAYIVKPKTSSVFEIDVYDTVMRDVKHLTAGTAKDRMNVAPIWSADGKFIVYTQVQSKETDSNVFLVDVSSAQSTLLTPHEGERTYSASDVSPNGKTVLITSNAGNGYDNVGLLDIASKKIRWVTQDKWETSAQNFSPDGKLLTYTSNADGNVDIYLYDIVTGKARDLVLPKGVNYPAGNPSPFTTDGSRMLFSHTGPTAPGDLWVYTFSDKPSHPNISRQLTSSLVGGVRAEDMVEPQLVHYPSKDGKWTISALVYVPYNLPRQAEHPAIVYVHGGPAAQTMNTFNRFIQYMANQGYIVIAPNYRGSTGYGKEFQQANLFDMGGGDLQDVLAAADWIKQTGYVDPKKLILMGGSYGGYLTMMGVTKAPAMWAAGVPIVPFVNWFTEIQNEDPVLQQSDLATMGDPEKNKALFHDRSPIFFVDQIKAPLFLLAGGNDPRCPEEESQQVIDAIKKRGGVVEFKIYENEGHGFAKVENQIDAYKRVADFLKAHVPPADCGCSLNE